MKTGQADENHANRRADRSRRGARRTRLAQNRHHLDAGALRHSHWRRGTLFAHQRRRRRAAAADHYGDPRLSSDLLLSPRVDPLCALRQKRGRRYYGRGGRALRRWRGQNHYAALLLRHLSHSADVQRGDHQYGRELYRTSVRAGVAAARAAVADTDYRSDDGGALRRTDDCQGDEHSGLSLCRGTDAAGGISDPALAWRGAADPVAGPQRRRQRHRDDAVAGDPGDGLLF